jgi:Skp family chaperone for outer membrane proteins
MTLFRKSINTIPIATVISLLAVTKSWAFTPSVYCFSSADDAVCELRIAEQLTIETTVANMEDNFNQHYQLSGTVNLVSGSTRFPLQQSDIIVSLGDEPELYGTAVIPFDRMPGLEKATFETLPRVVVGLAQGPTIEEVVGKPIPLNDGVSEKNTQRTTDMPYIFFHADAGLAMRYDFGENYKMLNEFVFTMPGSVSMTAIFDPADPYIYWSYDETAGIDLNGLKKKEEGDGVTIYDIEDDQGNLMIRFTQMDNGELTEHNLTTGEMIVYRQNGDGNYVMDGGDPNNPVILDGRQFDGSGGKKLADNDQDEDKKNQNGDDSDDKKGGADIGAFGISLNGWIPYEASSSNGMPADVGKFSGQLSLSGTIPLSGGVSIEGDVVTYIGERGFAQGGNGDVVWGLPFLPDFISFDIDLGNASAALKVTDEEQMTFVSGELKPDVAFLEDLLPIMPKAGARVQGYIGNDLQNAFVSIEGEMGMGADTFGKWIGVDLNSLNMTTAKMQVTADGFAVDGKTAMQIHPAIEINSEINVHASMSWTTPEDAVLRYSGNMNIYGVALEDVVVEISGRGMFVNGAFVTPLTRIGLSGTIDSAGANLSGRGQVVLGLGSITAAMQDAHNTLTDAQAEVNKIDVAINAMRKTVQAERDKHARAIGVAQSGVNRAQSTVNGLNKKVAAEYRSIKARKSQIRSWYRWYKKAKWYQKASRYSRYVYQKSWRNADIARRYATIGAYKTSLVAANAVLSAAKLSLNEVKKASKTFPIDLDPRLVSLFAAKETANVALEIAKAPFANVPLIEGDFAGDIELTLGTQGIDGSVSASISGYSLLKGSLSFDPHFEACIQVPTFGNACTQL